jgi:antitoxin (DNA-binding transcriptional repressor) of toxin-antitoxin stability system
VYTNEEFCMKFIGIRDFRNKSSRVWEELSSENELIITSNGKPIAILSAVTEENLEKNLKAFRQARALNALNELQRESVDKKRDSLSMDQINTEIRNARRDRPQ